MTKDILQNSVRGQLIDVLEHEGYSFQEASELASNCIASFLLSKYKRQEFKVKNAIFIITKR